MQDLWESAMQGGGKAACRGRGSEGGGETEQVYLGDGGVELRREARPPAPSLWQGHPLYTNTGRESVK